MNAKKYLGQLRRIDLLIRQKENEKEFLMGKATRSTRGPWKDVMVQESPPEDTRADLIIRIVELEKELDREIDRLIDARRIIVKQIQGLDDERHIRLLYMRYVEYKSLGAISREMAYTPEYTRQLHREALRGFERKYAKKIKHLTKSYIDPW